MKKILAEYGKSMYGGWYAQYNDGTKWIGIHADTFCELKIKATKMNIELSSRYDNDR